jgi:hypothetical protein
MKRFPLPSPAALAAGLAAMLALGCAETVRSQAHPGLAQRTESIDLVAVAPFRATGSLAVQRDPSARSG